MLESIEKAYEERDLEKLLTFATPIKRELNKKQNYKSVLMLSCNNIKHLKKLKDLKADAIILNLEDGVSKEEKPFALVLCAIFLSLNTHINKKLIVRVNSIEDGAYKEIEFLNAFSPDAIRIPKIKDSKEVESILKILNENVELHLSIETKESWTNLSSLNVNYRVKAFYLGVLDLFADMGLSQNLINLYNPIMNYILTHFLVSSKAIGVKPISFVYQDYKNLTEFSKWIELEKSMGYDSKGCISPKQVEYVNEMFDSDSLEIQKARRIVELFEKNRGNGVTGFTDDEFGFIDEPIYKGALVVLNKALQ